MERESLIKLCELTNRILKGTLNTSHGVAISTQEFVTHLVAKEKWKSAAELIRIVQVCMEKLTVNLPKEVISVNVMRHVLKLIRDEYFEILKNQGEIENESALTTALGLQKFLDYTKPLTDLRSNLLGILEEYKVELESSVDNIAAQAEKYIHDGEIILTVGRSNTVEKFLKAAAKTRKFIVIVVEGAPACQGHLLAENLIKSKIEVSVISDAAAFAVMPRINKVIIGTHSVLADGGLRTACGLATVAYAAKYSSVQVMVLTHMYKLEPAFLDSYQRTDANVLCGPASIISTSHGIANTGHVGNITYDCISPDLISLLITHQEGYAPSYVYSLLSQIYHREDNILNTN